MKKLLLILVAAAMCALFLSANGDSIAASAATDSPSGENEEADKYISSAVDKLLEGMDFSELDEEFADYPFFSGKGSAKDRIAALIKGDYKIQPNEILSSVLNSAFGDAREIIADALVVIAIALVTAITRAVSSSNENKSAAQTTYFVCFAVVVGMVGARFASVYGECAAAAATLEKQLEICFPVLLTLMAAGGGSSSAAIFRPQAAFLLKIMGMLVKKVLLPIVAVMFVFAAAGRMSERIKLGKVGDFLKSAFKWITGIITVVFNFFVTAQGIASSVYDGVSVKALKYALGNSVPLVGNLVSGGFDVVFASTVLIKNAVGSFALVAVLIVLLAPILKIAVFSLILRFAAAVAEPIGEPGISGFVSDVAGIMSYLTAALIVFAASYVILLLLIICSLGGAI